jgi:hypothetical protein
MPAGHWTVLPDGRDLGEIYASERPRSGPNAHQPGTRQRLAGKGLSPERRDPIGRPSPMARKESGVDQSDAKDCPGASDLTVGR